MHEQCLLHLDIKPSNFGVAQRGKKLLMDNVYLFDTNTIHSFFEKDYTILYTLGYCAKEIRDYSKDAILSLSDIYSIGCVLFDSIFNFKDYKVHGYFDNYFKDIPKFVEDSELIKSVCLYKSVSFKYDLIAILEKCLNVNPRKRYQSCEDLKDDLTKLQIQLIPNEYDKVICIDGQYKRLAFEDIEKSLDQLSEFDPRLAFLHSLYENPIYNLSDKNTINVVIAGFGTYSRYYLETILQSCQVLDKKLQVKILTENKDVDKKSYLSQRPALKDFFTIDGEACEDSYGEISFINATVNNSRDIVAFFESTKQVSFEKESTDCVFVALGDDAINEKIAKCFSEVLSNIKKKNLVNFATENKDKTRQANIIPVCASKEISETEKFKELEDMAFNVHLSWENLNNVDFDKAWNKFKEPYNYNSSISNALAIKSKLFSLGIESDDPIELAKLFEAKKHKNPDVMEKLAYLEHRRWVVEKICDGWTCKTDPESCSSTGTQDKVNKKHICIVGSSLKRSIDKNRWNNNEWDSFSAEEIKMLDPLDYVSFCEHKSYYNAANEIRNEYVEVYKIISRIYLKFKETQEALGSEKANDFKIAFNKWQDRVIRVWNNSNCKSNEYEARVSNLTEVVKNSNLDEKAVLGLIEEVSSKVEKLIKSQKYTDYKKYDEVLVDNIPFILTYKHDLSLLTTFSVGEKSQVFENIAPTLIIRPETILYTYYLADEDEVELVKSSIEMCDQLAKKKSLTFKSQLTIFVSPSLKRSAENLFESIENVEFFDNFDVCAVEDEKKLNEYISKFAAENKNIILQKKADKLSKIIAKNSSVKTAPSFEFCSKDQKLKNAKKCEFLKYLKVSANLKISDIFEVQESVQADNFRDFNFDLYFKSFREKYSEELAYLRSSLHEYICANAEIVSFIPMENEFDRQIEIILPMFAFETCKHLISCFKSDEIKAMDADSRVEFYTTDSCKVTFKTNKHNVDELKEVFRDKYKLQSKSGWSVRNFQGMLKIEHHSLDVENLAIEASKVDTLCEIMQKLNDDFNIIDNVEFDFGADGNANLSFSFTSSTAKYFIMFPQCATQNCVYTKCKSSKKFDEVIKGVDITLEEASDYLTHRISAINATIVTKGFKSLLIVNISNQCDESERDYALMREYVRKNGINSKILLVFDEKPEKEKAKKLDDIFTIVDISKILEIEEIAADLLK